MLKHTQPAGARLQIKGQIKGLLGLHGRLAVSAAKLVQAPAGAALSSLTAAPAPEGRQLAGSSLAPILLTATTQHQAVLIARQRTTPSCYCRRTPDLAQLPCAGSPHPQTDDDGHRRQGASFASPRRRRRAAQRSAAAARRRQPGHGPRAPTRDGAAAGVLAWDRPRVPPCWRPGGHPLAGHSLPDCRKPLQRGGLFRARSAGVARGAAPAAP